MSKRLFKPSLLLLILVAAGNAFGQFDESVLYRITAKHSGKCLAVANGVRALNDGDKVIQWDCIESETNQKWRVVWVEGDFYKIIAKHSSKALDVYGGIVSQGNGVSVVQWEYHDGDNQKWEIVCAENGYYQLIAKHSGRVLDIDGGPAATWNGPFAQQWDNWRGDNQKWMFTVSLTDLPRARATRTNCPSAAVQAGLGINIFPAAIVDPARRTDFAIDEPFFLKVENIAAASAIYFDEAINTTQLIREEGLQVERLILDFWVPVFPSGICGPTGVRRRSSDGTGTVIQDYPSPTRRRALVRTTPVTRRWKVPAAIGPGTYRLSFVYHTRVPQGPSSTVCSEAFVVR
jgi:Ricin-type beta-trefoil lectin domain-like